MTEQEQKELNKQLSRAASNDNLKRVKEVLDEGADIEAKDENGTTALHWASFLRHLEIVKELLESGADVEVETNIGYTPLHFAAITKRLNIAKELLGAGAKTNLDILAKFPKEIIMRWNSTDVWSDILLFIVREQPKFEEEDFKKIILEFLENTKTEIPENIKIILNTLI